MNGTDLQDQQARCINGREYCALNNRVIPMELKHLYHVADKLSSRHIPITFTVLVYLSANQCVS